MLVIDSGFNIDPSKLLKQTLCHFATKVCAYSAAMPMPDLKAAFLPGDSSESRPLPPSNVLPLPPPDVPVNDGAALNKEVDTKIEKMEAKMDRMEKVMEMTATQMQGTACVSNVAGSMEARGDIDATVR